jgi:hypothetical protein
MNEIFEEVSPCVGCGYCCQRSLCEFALEFVDDSVPEGECPFLYRDGDRFKCALADHPPWAERLCIGEGCCSGMNGRRLKIIEERGHSATDPAYRIAKALEGAARRKS